MEEWSSLRSFSRERVRSRMLHRAAELWNVPDSEAEAFDPLVGLLIEAYAVEVERIAHEIEDSRTRTLERMARLMTPETADTPAPAHGILFVRPTETDAVVNPSHQFTARKPVSAFGAAGSSDSSTSDLFFSPAGRYRIVDGTVRFILTNRTLYQWTGPQRTAIATISTRKLFDPSVVWLGLDLNDQLTNTANLRFFVDWKTENEKAGLYRQLTQAQWFINGKPLETRCGERADVDSVSWMLPGMNPLQDALLRVKTTYQPGFVTLPNGLPTDWPKLRKAYPTVFDDVFRREDLTSLQQPLLWVQVRFPASIPPDAFSGLSIMLNGIPIVNRKLHKLNHRIGATVNCLLLEAESDFLGIESVQDGPHHWVSEDTLPSHANPEVRHYALRFNGIRRFEARNAREQLQRMLEQVRDEAAAYAAFDQEYLSTELRDLNQQLTRLEKKATKSSSKRNHLPYLLFRSGQPGDTVQVQYWSCDGLNANRLPSGTRLEAYSGSEFRSDELFLLTPTTGGQNRPTPNELVLWYRQTLLTRNRLVSVADIRSECLAVLGEALKTVFIHRSVAVKPDHNQGYEQILQVELLPANPLDDREEWLVRGHELEQLLTERAAILLPIRVVVRWNEMD